MGFLFKIKKGKIAMAQDNKGFIPEDDESFERRLYEEQKLALQNDENAKAAAENAKRELEKKRDDERSKRIMQEKIELMKLKSGVIEESEIIKEEKTEEKKMTLKEKVSNFFYHYKIPVIVIVFFAAAISYIVYDTVTRDKPDMYIISTCNNGLEFRLDKLEEYFEKYCPDLNGDGTVHVQIVSAPETDDLQLQGSNQMKIASQLQMDQAIIILTCDENYDLTAEVDENGNYTDNSYIFAEVFRDMTQDFPENENVDVKGYHFHGDAIEKALEWEEMPENIVLSLREPYDPIYGDYEVMQENYDLAMDILKKIMEENSDL